MSKYDKEYYIRYKQRKGNKCKKCEKLLGLVCPSGYCRVCKYQDGRCPMIGFKHKQQTKDKLSLMRLNENNPMWKGDNVGYGAIHAWVKKNKPKPEFCEICKEKTPIDLANISQEYHRNTEDFEWLCRKCHMNKDGRIKNLKQYEIKK